MKQTINLLTTIYKVPVETRWAEIVTSLRHNCFNEKIDRVIVFAENMSDKDLSADVFQYAKIKIVHIKKRLTYNDWFNYANTYLPGQIVVCSNVDINYDESIEYVRTVRWASTFGIVTRIAMEGYLQAPDGTSSDTWVFVPPIPIDGGDIKIGVPGCDNLIVEHAYKGQMRVVNLSKIIRAYHNHASDVKNYPPKEQWYHNDPSFRNMGCKDFITEPEVLGDVGEHEMFEYLSHMPIWKSLDCELRLNGETVAFHKKGAVLGLPLHVLWVIGLKPVTEFFEKIP